MSQVTLQLSPLSLPSLSLSLLILLSLITVGSFYFLLFVVYFILFYISFCYSNLFLFCFFFLLLFLQHPPKPLHSICLQHQLDWSPFHNLTIYFTSSLYA